MCRVRRVALLSCLVTAPATARVYESTTADHTLERNMGTKLTVHGGDDCPLPSHSDMTEKSLVQWAKESEKTKLIVVWKESTNSFDFKQSEEIQKYIEGKMRDLLRDRCPDLAARVTKGEIDLESFKDKLSVGKQDLENVGMTVYDGIPKAVSNEVAEMLKSDSRIETVEVDQVVARVAS